jgi:ribosomal protein S18 acetylase RimI-like enzyme
MKPRIYVLTENHSRAVAGLFCVSLQGGTIRRLGSLTNFYTMEYGPSIVEENIDRAAAIRRLIEYISKEQPRWHIVNLKFLKDTSSEAQRVLESLSKAGFRNNVFFQYENWYVDLADTSFAQYFSARNSQLRNTVTRKQKKLEKAHKYDIRILRSGSDDLQSGIDDFVAVYNSSWKQPEPFPEFIPALVRECAKLGILRLGVLLVDGKPAAAQLWINTARTALIYKLAYDEQYRDFGVGSILSKELFRIAIDEDRVSEIDYGVGSEPYKKDWMTSVRTIEGVEAFNQRTFIGVSLQVVQKTLKPAAAAIFRRYREKTSVQTP